MQHRGDEPHRLTSRHDRASNQTDNETENEEREQTHEMFSSSCGHDGRVVWESIQHELGQIENAGQNQP